MDCTEIIFSRHAFAQMISRNISDVVVKEALLDGEAIKEYTDDRPYPSQLMF